MASTDVMTHKVAVMGSGGVGKSALTLRYINNEFVQVHDPTIEDTYRKKVQIDGTECMVDLLDTAGQEDYSMLRSSWMRDRDGFIFVYSLLDEASYQALQSFYDQLISIYEEIHRIPPIVICGNKSDLTVSRRVDSSAGSSLASKYGNNTIYLETSALMGTNVAEAFTHLLREMKQREDAKNALKKNPSQSSCCTIS